jgi:RNA polymerase primary sigma factor
MRNALNEREVRIMSLRYGLVDGTPWTLHAIAKELGVSRERVRQLFTRSQPINHRPPK